jgi:hypothetical protein
VITGARILAASALAPLVFTVPWFVFGYFVWRFLSRDMPSIRGIDPVDAVGSSALYLHVGLVLCSAFVAFGLRACKALSRRALVVAAAALACVVGVWLSCDWESGCTLVEAIPQFLVQSLISFAIFGGVFVAWWRLASVRTRMEAGSGET